MIFLTCPSFCFIGLKNFIELFQDKIFFKAIQNNIIWTLLFLTIPVCIGMLAAMLLLSRKKTRSIYQVAFLIPYVLAPSVNAMLWLNVVFSPVSGVLSVFRNMGFDISSPLADMKTAIYGCAAVDIWHYWSYLTVIYLAALRQVPTDQVEAARLDGATNLEVFLKITLPLSKPMVVYTMLTQFAWPWSDVLLPKLLLKDRNMWTVAVGLFNLPETHFARFAAGSVFIAIPIVILYFCLVKNIVNGLTAGSVKG